MFSFLRSQSSLTEDYNVTSYSRSLPTTHRVPVSRSITVSILSQVLRNKNLGKVSSPTSFGSLSVEFQTPITVQTLLKGPYEGIGDPSSGTIGFRTVISITDGLRWYTDVGCVLVLLLVSFLSRSPRTPSRQQLYKMYKFQCTKVGQDPSF